MSKVNLYKGFEVELFTGSFNSHVGISGDIETAIVFFGAIANSDIDIEFLIYKYFGDIPTILLKKMFVKSSKKESKADNNKINKLLKSLRDISIRLDRIEQEFANQ